MPVTRPLLSCSPFLSFQSALRASGQSCAQCPWFLDNLHSCSQKSHVHRRTQSTFVRCSCCTTASCVSLSPSVTRAARACSFSVSRCGCLGRRNSRGRGEFQCIQLGYWVDGCFGGAGLTVFSCGKHKHTVGHSVLVVQTHTNRLSHFSFFLPANFLHLLFFLPVYFLEPTIYFLEPTIYCLFTFLTYMFNTFATTTWLLKPLSVL